MDARFVRAWKDLRDERKDGKRFEQALGDAPTAQLIAALAAAGREDDVAANALATELLNRYRRAPFLGAFIVGITSLFIFLATDFVLTGTLYPWGAGVYGRILVAFAGVTVLVSILCLLLWRGHLPAVRASLIRRRTF